LFPFPPERAEGIGEGAEEGADEYGGPRGDFSSPENSQSVRKVKESLLYPGGQARGRPPRRWR